MSPSPARTYRCLDATGPVFVGSSVHREPATTRYSVGGLLPNFHAVERQTIELVQD